MAMVYSSLFLSNFFPLSPTKCTKTLTSLYPYFPSIQHNNNNFRERDFALPRVASITYPPTNENYLEGDFIGHDGVTIEDISDSRVVKLGLDNGSVATLMLPSGLVTSYKAPMWHGGMVELLQTSVSEGEAGEAIIQDGVSLAFNCEGDGGVSWSPSTWALGDVRGSPQ